MDLGLKGRVCVVTGASGGIGLEVTRQLCDEGAKVVMVSRDPEQLAAMREVVRAEGGEVEVVVQDVTVDCAGQHIIASAKQSFGKVDVLVNNAGVAEWKPLEEASEDDFRFQFEMSVIAPLNLMRAAIPEMAEQGWGRVVNVSSTAGKRPSSMMPDYSVGKAAMLSLSRQFAERHASEGVMVNAICPGPTASDLWMAEGGLLDQAKEAAGHETREEALRAAGEKRPIGRLATPEEIASAIVFLCSERASYVSGAAWGIDGGTVPVII
ncbi:MAG: SDR family oxidoreductase [Solirubrobacterales bacterium]|jgi:3-oxoacyl-[acyl-carrier protein] reductase|nr:SDR family oxidoreductase [Solirubrobacterales bacterium]